MARVLGASGRYVTAQVREKRVKGVVMGLGSVAIAAAAAGFLFGRSLPGSKASPMVSFSITTALLVGVAGLFRWCLRQVDSLENDRAHMQRGADGEDTVAQILTRFPNDFHVVHDITTPFGNLDHVVIGPTGVFVLDAKNWRGVVSPDGKGELLVNGKPTSKPEIRRFVGRMMSVRDKVKVIAPKFDPFYHALFVFTAARVDAKWGTTGKVNCLTDDQLFDYIVENNFGQRLTSEEVEQIAQAFLTLAHMDPDFTQRASIPGSTHRPAVAMP